jgi:tripartite-type tricarboxylate transporter receptor subunit TctC
MRYSVLGGSLALAAGALAMATGGLVRPAAADEVADFYKGKTLEVYNGLSAGGAYWTYARVLTQHMSKHLPGHPTMILKTKAGGTSRVLANWLYNVAPKDGLVFGGLHERMGLEPRINPQGIKFDGLKFNWIGSIATQKSVCITWHTSKVKTIKDALTTQAIVSSTGTTATASVMPRMMNVMVGTKFKIIVGYEIGEVFLAMERGEVDGMCGYGWASLKTQKPDWIRDKKLNMLLQFAKTPHPELPNVPTMVEQVTKTEDKQALDILFGTQEMGRPYAAPPGVPQVRVAALRKAFDATMKDPAFRQAAERSLLEIDPLSGEGIQKLMVELYAYPKEVSARVVSFRKPIKAFEEKRQVKWITVSTTLTAAKGSKIGFMANGEAHESKLSGKATNITVAGKKAKSAALKAGMKCAVTYPGNMGQAKTVACD